jgi:NADH-quinone oxidoreductase subunit K
MNLLTMANQLETYLIIGAVLFGIGLYGMVRRSNFIGMLISAELMLAGASLNFMAFNRFAAPEPVTGQVFTLFIMAIAAAETAIVLSIIIAVYRNFKTIETEDLTDMKG